MTEFYYSVEGDFLLTKQQAMDDYNSALDAGFDPIKVGDAEYDYSRSLLLIDPVCYRQGFLDYCDSEFVELDVPWELTLLDDDGNAINEYIIQTYGISVGVADYGDQYTGPTFREFDE